MGGIEVAVGGSLIGAAVLYGISAAVARFRTRRLRRFWSGYEKAFAIMVTEYELDASADAVDLGDAAVASTATSRAFLSYGMAMALTHLVAYFRQVARFSPEVIGDKMHHAQRRDRSLIVLGSPANNVYLQTFIEQFGSEFPMLAQFKWTTTAAGVTLTLPSGEILKPKIDEHQCGVDYALVAHMPLDPSVGSRLTIISGCNMWATDAAARFLTTARQIKLLPDVACDPHHAVAFVLQALITHEHPDQVRMLDIGSQPVLALAADAP
jgi:hypothetical protein